MDPVDRGGSQIREHIGKTHLLRRGDPLHGLDVELDLGVEMFVRCFRRHGTDQDDHWLAQAVVAMALQLDEEGLEQGFRLRQSSRTLEALVKAEGGENDIGLVRGKLLVEIAKPFGPRPQRHLIGRPRQIANHKPLAGKPLVQQGLELAVVTHPVEQRVANQADAAAGGKLKGQLCRRGGGQQEEKAEADHPAKTPACRPVQRFFTASAAAARAIHKSSCS